MSDTLTGGCQCGAIRFHVSGKLGTASICHCRMCQKAFGGFFAPLVNVRDANYTWTRGTPKTFQSSNHVARGFCADCGTPLTYDAPDGLTIAIGAFDRPDMVKPTIQYGFESRVTWVGDLDELTSMETTQETESASFLNDIRSNQHPDHDTAKWPAS